MIVVKNSDQIRWMRRAGKITAQALEVAREAIRVGVSTAEIDRKIRHYIEKCGAVPSFLGYGGFPGSACISRNREVIHGIPSPRVFLEEGDIVKVDVGACYHGYHGDAARTYTVGTVSPAAAALIAATEDAFWAGFRSVRAGARIGDIGHAVQTCARSRGYSVVRAYVGHGVGAALHEEPEVPNFGNAGHGVRICSGMTLAIEPMVNEGSEEVKVLEDGWTVVTADGRLSAHYENSVLVTDDGAEILTATDSPAPSCM